MAESDIFPLTPVYPVQRDFYDRDVRVPMDDKNLMIRSRGENPQMLTLTGFGSIADQATLQTFHEAQATDVFTFQDQSFGTERDVVVRFAGPPSWEEWFEYMIWKCTLRTVPA